LICGVVHFAHAVLAQLGGNTVMRYGRPFMAPAAIPPTSSGPQFLRAPLAHEDQELLSIWADISSRKTQETSKLDNESLLLPRKTRRRPKMTSRSMVSISMILMALPLVAHHRQAV